MRLIFTKGSGKFDYLEVFRTGATPERIDCPKQRIIPHDMVHFAVEHTLNARGFLRRVAEGASAAFTMRPEAGSDAVERLVEVFQGDEWSGRPSTAADLIDMYRITTVARSCSPIPLDVADIDAIRNAIADLTMQWEHLPIGGKLQLEL